MQQCVLLHGRPEPFRRVSLLGAIRAVCFFIFGGLIEVTPVGATEINTLSANANCDTVSVRQAKRPEDEDDRIDWFAVGREHREFTGKQLLPEHQPDEPEADTVIGCAIENEGSSLDTQGFAGEEEVAEMEFAGWAKSSALAQESEEKAEQESALRPQGKSTAPEKDLIEYLKTEASWVAQGAVILVLATLIIGCAFGLRFFYKIAFGLLQRRRVCHIPCSLVTTRNHVIEGNMTVIGLRSFRFVPKSSDEMAYFKRTLDEPEMFYFSVHVGDLELDVFVDGIRSYYSPVAFDERLTAKVQKHILGFSTMTPQIGQLIVVPYNIKKHKAHLKNRASNKVYMDTPKTKKKGWQKLKPSLP